MTTGSRKIRRLTSSTCADEGLVMPAGRGIGRTSSSASARRKPLSTREESHWLLVASAEAPTRAKLARPTRPAALARMVWLMNRLNGGSELTSGEKSPHSSALRMRPTRTRSATLAPSRGVITASWDNAEGL